MKKILSIFSKFFYFMGSMLILSSFYAGVSNRSTGNWAGAFVMALCLGGLFILLGYIIKNLDVFYRKIKNYRNSISQKTKNLITDKTGNPIENIETHQEVLISDKKNNTQLKKRIAREVLYFYKLLGISTLYFLIIWIPYNPMGIMDRDVHYGLIYGIPVLFVVCYAYRLYRWSKRQLEQ